jgi:hypothetical protein
VHNCKIAGWWKRNLLVTAPLDELAGRLGKLTRPSGWQHRFDALETEVYRTRRERRTAARRHPSQKETA